eukprot:241581-Ditylum_brightwellii.AAC.1
MSRRSRTKLPVNKEDQCPVFFVLGSDNLSYPIKCGYGNSIHYSHMDIIYNNESFALSKLMNKSQQSI